MCSLHFLLKGFVRLVYWLDEKEMVHFADLLVQRLETVKEGKTCTFNCHHTYRFYFVTNLLLREWTLDDLFIC